jgi:radical SAM superfamily enzyme with C-terminal helix-hairpin-helix motif
VIIAGMTVPGKYLRGTPVNLTEIIDITHAAAGRPVILGGPVRLGYGIQGGIRARNIDHPGLITALEDIEAFVYDMLGSSSFIKNPESLPHRQRSIQEIARWGVKGAFVIKQHPDYPDVMCELETYRGCTRPQHCSFCTEPFYGNADFRNIKDITAEVGSLYHNGARYFRIGRQPDLFSYMAKDTGEDLLRPDPEVIERLYKGIRSAAPQLKVLHMDNANPATIAAYPGESDKIIHTIIQYHTPGDVAAMGIESADPKVVRANCLGAMPEDVHKAVRLINHKGCMRGENGLPELLPGLNFIYGLKAETKKTFQLNFQFLKYLLDSGLMIRRINIRQVMVFQGTPISKEKNTNRYHDLFIRTKNKIRHEIDHPMLKRIVPAGTILKDVMCEININKNNSITFGRQIASYPLLVGIPAELKLGRFIDITVTGHGQRSITGIPYPLDINNADLALVAQLHGVGKKKMQTIIRNRPFKDKKDLVEKVGNIEGILPYIVIT